MDVDARSATSGDLEVLAAMVTAAGEEIGGMKGGPVWLATAGRSTPYEARLAEEISDPDAPVVVGTIDGSVIAYGVGRLVARAEGTVLEITDLWVLPGAREVGVAEAVMDQLLDTAGRAGAVAAESSVLPGNREGKNFFERYGLVARAILVRRDLRDRPV